MRTRLLLFAVRRGRERARTTLLENQNRAGTTNAKAWFGKKAGQALAEAALRVEKRWEPATPKAPAAI